MSSGSTDRRGFLFSPWVQGSLLLALIALGASLQVYSTHRWVIATNAFISAHIKSLQKISALSTLAGHRSKQGRRAVPCVCQISDSTCILALACRLRAHEVILRRKHEAALSNLQQAAGHCDAAGGVQNLNAVADFIRSEIDHHFNLHDPDDDSQASWFSRAAAGLLMLGMLPLPDVQRVLSQSALSACILCYV